MKNPPPLESQSLVGQAVSTDSSVHAADDEDKSIRGIISCQHTIKEQHCTAACLPAYQPASTQFQLPPGLLAC